MLHSTLLSHVILAVFLYICTVAALTDREIEKIISTAVSGDDAKGLRRYPNIEDIGEFKNRLDALEDLSDEGSEGFGSVGTEGETDGTYATAIRSKRDASLENSADVVHQYLAQKSQQNRNQNIKPYRNVKTLSKHSFAQTGLNHIKNVGNPREVQNTGKRFYRITRRNAPQQTFNKVQKMSQISEGTGRNDAHERKRSVSHNNFKDKTNNILEKVRKCLLDESCLKRHVAKFVSKDLGKDNFKVQTRNVFCNRRGCGRKKRSAIGQDEGQLRDAIHDDNTSATVIRSKRDANSGNMVHQHLAQKSRQNREQNVKPYRNVKTLSKHSLTKADLNHIAKVGNPREPQNTVKRFYSITRGNAPQQTYNKVQKMSQISEGTGRNNAHRSKRSVNHNNFIKDKTNNILEKVRKCLSNESCLKRHVAKSISKDIGKDNFKVQTRNVFCNYRGCGGRKISAISQDEGQGQIRNEMHDYKRSGIAGNDKRDERINGDSAKEKRKDLTEVKEELQRKTASGKIARKKKRGIHHQMPKKKIVKKDIFRTCGINENGCKKYLSNKKPRAQWMKHLLRRG